MRLAVATVVDSGYEWYAPTFCATAINTPGVDVIVAHRGEFSEECIKILESLPRDRVTIHENIAINIPDTSYHNAALRFLLDFSMGRASDYFFITDSDFLFYDLSDLIDSHLSAMRLNRLEHYENFACKVFHKGAGDAVTWRMPGIHFCTPEWFEATREARGEEMGLLYAQKELPRGYDEEVLYLLAKNSRLPIVHKGHENWRWHGYHLGKIREAKRVIRPDGNERADLLKIFDNPDYQEILSECGKHVPHLLRLRDAVQN